LDLGEGLTTSERKKTTCYKMLTQEPGTGRLLWNDLDNGKWRWDLEHTNLCNAGSLRAVASELAKYNLDLVTAEWVRWIEDCSQPGDC
jgi:hypothetical protein